MILEYAYVIWPKCDISNYQVNWKKIKEIGLRVT